MVVAMPHLILAGVSRSILMRNRVYAPAVPGWQVTVVPSQVFKNSVARSWSEVLRTANDTGDDGAHILAFHGLLKERKQFERSVYGRHRLTWLDRPLLTLYGSTDFDLAIEKIADSESRWRDQIRPPNHRHALILPECSFTPQKGYAEMWGRAQHVAGETDQLNQVAKLLVAFRRTHYATSGVWRDRFGLVFDPSAEPHAAATRENRWKYTYLAPEGFHYDVRSSDGRKFQVRDRSGVSYSFSDYTNVDCQGAIRDGH